MPSLELRIPPPLIALSCAGLMWLVAAGTPSASWPAAGRHVLAGMLAAAGVCVSMSGVATFRRAGTTVNPHRPRAATSLVTGGIYRYTRNPMYLGLLMVLLGWGIFLANGPAVLLIAGFVLYIGRFQIAPEERALSDLFGPEYEAYRDRVRRWL
ncbi:MAG: hypothetical protein NFCOHLIN_02428 [Gammaproteobacteria bacterium]|nr:hypothetical protein [Gammaproteobacteria bacterium]